MAQLRVGLAQVDPTVGDLQGNADLVARAVGDAAAAGCDVVVLPEMVLPGYPAEDLVLRRSFVQANLRALDGLAARLEREGHGDVLVVVGYCGRTEHATPALGRPAGAPQNAAALVHGGRVVASYAKHHLPNYGVFDEYRYFVRGDRYPLVRVRGVDVGVVICEDLWQDGGPVGVACEAGTGLLLCPNGSPYELGKAGVRRDLVARRAREACCPIAYVNAYGGQDELVFDGGSFVVDRDGRVLAEAPRFIEALLVVDLDLPTETCRRTGAVTAGDGTSIEVSHVVVSDEPAPAREPVPAQQAPPLAQEAEVWAALVLATRDYVRKNGFRSVALGLSGGIDSAVVATIAHDAVGPEAVHVLGMPSAWSSEHSVADARELAERQGLQWRLVPVQQVVDAFQTALGGVTGLAAENLQARVRGQLLMTLSNAEGHLVLTTGNKSELATGFSTLYGDSAGGFGPLKDVPKSLVWRLARWRNAQGDGELIPVSSIEKPPSAELAPGQLDSDRLPDYAVLDAVLDAYVERDLGRDELLEQGFDAEVVDRVMRLVDLAEHKRRQYPPGPKVTSRAFGRDRRLPITSRWREA